MLLSIFNSQNSSGAVATYSVTFHVKDSHTNANIAGATIDVATVGIETTGVDGKAVFVGLSPATYNFTISKTGYNNSSGNFTVVASDLTPTVNLIDPIQDLVDEYKAYVTSQGGVHGLTDGELYTLYDDAVTAGEITNTGVNTKGIFYAGLAGYKLSGTDISHFYDPFKDGSGNWRSYTQSNSANYPVLDTNKIIMISTTTRIIDFPINYGTDSFKLIVKAKIVRDATTVSILNTSAPTVNGKAFQTWTTGALRCYLYNPTSIAFYAPNNYCDANVNEYEFVFNRGAGKVTINFNRNGSTIGSSAERDWTTNFDGTTFTERIGGGAGTTFEVYYVKYVKL